MAPEGLTLAALRFSVASGFSPISGRTEDRLVAVVPTRPPCAGSAGACAMVNSGAKGTMPELVGNRNLHVHNPQVTLMRTTPEENRRIGGWIAERPNRCEGPVRLLLSLGGVSAIDAPGAPSQGPEADAAPFGAIRGALRRTAERRTVEAPRNVNDPDSAAALVRNSRDIAA